MSTCSEDRTRIFDGLFLAQNQDKVEVDSSMADNLDASTSVDEDFFVFSYAKTLRVSQVSTTPMTDEQNTVLAGKNAVKILPATSKRTHKHKHHHCHRHHRVTKATQQPRIVYREATQKNSPAKIASNILDVTQNKPVSTDVQQQSSDDRTIVSNGEICSSFAMIPCFIDAQQGKYTLTTD